MQVVFLTLSSAVLSSYSICHLSVVQCNILFSARRYKLQLFTGFRRQVVVVFPSADEWKRRLTLQQTSDGEQIPETALLKLQGLFDLFNWHYMNLSSASHARHFCLCLTTFLPSSSELQSSRAAGWPAGGAAVCRAAAGTGTDTPAGVQRGGSPTAAPHPQTGEEESPNLQEKTPPTWPSALT